MAIIMKKIIPVVVTLMLVCSPAQSREYLSIEELRSHMHPVGKYKDKGKNWCQLYKKDSFIMKNLKSGEVRKGTIFVKGDKLCLKGPKMTRPQCSRGFWLKDRKKIKIESNLGGWTLKTSSKDSKFNTCSF